MFIWGKVDKVFEGLCASNTLFTANTAPVQCPSAVAARIKTNYTEASYVAIGADTTATSVLDYKIPFEKIRNTLLALDKDIYFDEDILQINLIWNPTAKFTWNSTNRANGDCWGNYKQCPDFQSQLISCC